MRTKAIIEESFEYYKEPVMLIAAIGCSFKCCKESELPISTCINAEWATKPIRNIPNPTIIERYVSNPICRALCFAGLEPLDQIEELRQLVEEFHNVCGDPIIIYTGYQENEVAGKLATFPRILVKFGRFIPNQLHHIDPLLGVELASPNQYAKWIGEKR